MSILPVILRLFEKVAFNLLKQYLIENNLIQPGQSGFFEKAFYIDLSS